MGYVNVVSETGNRWKGKDVELCEIPDYSMDNLNLYRDTLMEAVAETSEEFMDRYFGGETFSENEFQSHKSFLAACISHTTPMPFLYLPQRQTYLIPP